MAARTNMGSSSGLPSISQMDQIPYHEKKVCKNGEICQDGAIYFVIKQSCCNKPNIKCKNLFGVNFCLYTFSGLRDTESDLSKSILQGL